MEQPTSYQPRRFQSAVPYYERFRLGYPERLIARVIALVGLRPGDAVLDLGSGPGLLAIPFARAGLAVTAADPEPDMLAAAEVAARAAGVHLDLWQGGSYDLAPGMGPWRLVAMGRAFHWMDRAATLAVLDKLVTPDGAIAFFHDGHPDVADNRWFKTLHTVGDRYGRQQAPHVAERKQGGHRRYESYLFDSAFTVLDGLSVTIRRAITTDEIVGRAFSQSTSSPERLGDKAAAFEADLRAGLAELSADGQFTEVAELAALVARRP